MMLISVTSNNGPALLSQAPIWRRPITRGHHRDLTQLLLPRWWVAREHWNRRWRHRRGGGRPCRQAGAGNQKEVVLNPVRVVPKAGFKSKKSGHTFQMNQALAKVWPQSHCSCLAGPRTPSWVNSKTKVEGVDKSKVEFVAAIREGKGHTGQHGQGNRFIWLYNSACHIHLRWMFLKLGD